MGHRMVTGLPTSSLDWRIMGLADDLMVVRREPKLCPFGRLLRKLDKPDRVALERVTAEIRMTPPELRAAGQGTVTIKWILARLSISSTPSLRIKQITPKAIDFTQLNL